ncbi:winged helix-turn-helix domain-containing protein [Paenibacillus glycanilyticus]|uniref:winged helix-turn-helix domain-containing protein n=1 Tax=Paenibacillus glycanilyticus TaxID=126569 RepID=UPI0020422F1D|nr:winged helix-turn-helix domain-containing protein [Paenibacillus glycanilyticus]MCM3627038.1 winged helix-turn-helix domain-containing protein [Paenibacillus glycanilyticus]
MTSEIQYGELSVNPRTKEAFACGEPLYLSAKEFELLEYLLLNREQVLSKEQLLSQVRGCHAEVGISSIEVYIHYLRKKLAPSGCQRYIRNVRGVGFMFRMNGLE